MTYVAVTPEVPWETLRDRVTRLMTVEHEHVVPLLGAAPVPGSDAERPRGVLLVWEEPGVRLDDLSRRADLALGHVVGALVAAGRALAALHAHDLAAGTGDVLAALRVRADGDVRILADDGLSVAGDLLDPSGRREAVRALARAGHGLLARSVEPDGAARDLAHLLATTGLDPQTEPPAPGTLAAMCLEIHLPALAADWARIVAPPPEPEPTAPLVTPPVEAALTLDRVDASARTWREHIEQQPAPAQGRRRAVAPGATRSRRAHPAAPSRTPAAAGVGSLRVMLPAQPDRRRSRHRVLAGAAAALVVGTAVGVIQLRGSVPADGVAVAQAAPGVSGAAPARPQKAEEADQAPARPDPGAAAAALTTRRAELLAGVRTVAPDELAARRAELVTALRSVHTDGPSLAADLALVDKLLDGQSTMPDVTTEVVGTTVVQSTTSAAAVDVDYRIVDAWGTAQQRVVRLTLVWEDGAWLADTVSAAG